MGDLNDSAHRRSLFKYLFDYLKDKRYTHMKPQGTDYPPTRVNGSEIDHIFGSSKLLGEALEPSTFHIHSREDDDISRKDYRKIYSDHYLLTVDVDPVDDSD